MDIALSRRGGVPIRDQLRFQLELKILTGDLPSGHKLASVRALAQRLKLHPNTVAAAYRDLEATGHVEVRRGAGVFVKPENPHPAEPVGLDEIVRLALGRAFQGGFGAAEIRERVSHWLDAALPERVVVVDAAREMAELLAEEARQAFRLPVAARMLAEVQARPALLSGVVALALPYHVDPVARLSAAAAVAPLTIEIPEEARQAILGLSDGAVLLLVSHAPTVLPFAEVLLRALRGDTAVVQATALSAAAEWHRLAPFADLVLADVLSLDRVRALQPRRTRELRLLSPATIERVGGVVAAVAAGRREVSAGA